MAEIDQRDAVMKERLKLRMESDYDSFNPPERAISAENRIANAADYTAYQMGQINRKLDKLIAAVELLATKA